MSFLIEKSIWEQFPEMLLVVAYADGIDNHVDNAAVAEALQQVQQEVTEGWAYPNAQSHPFIAAWRSTFRQAMNLKGGDFPSSIEALVKRVLSGRGLFSINPLVNFYNVVSLRHVVPVGGWDVDGMIGGNIHLRHTRAAETFHELGATDAVSVNAGEVCYADEAALITRHFVWRQSEEAKVTSETRRLFLVSEILPAAGRTVATEVSQEFLTGMRKYFGVDAQVSILQTGEERWDWAVHA
jgi:DNA/RNA-binding domain of Phe-tRNA-synthetase-like protein